MVMNRTNALDVRIQAVSPVSIVSWPKAKVGRRNGNKKKPLRRMLLRERIMIV
jgi:hypothetical protein